MKQGWEIRKLGDICEISTGKSNTEDAIETGEYAFFDRSKIVKRSSKFLFDCDAIIVAGEGQTFLPKFYSGKFDLHQRAYAIYNFDKSVNVHYVYKYLIHFHKYFERVAVGATAKSLRLRHFQELLIPIPPISDQHLIVSILDEAFAAIALAKANAEQNLKNAKELFENSLQTIFTVKRGDWSEKLLGELATFRNGINYTKGSKGEKIKIVGVKDFQNSFLVPTENLDEVIIDGKLNEIDRLQDGDILAVRSNGNPQLIGRTLLANNIHGQVSHSGFTIRIRLNSKKVLPNYLCRYLKTQKTRKELVESGNGVGIKSLNQGSLSSLKIPFPTSLKEQEVVMKKLNLISVQSQRLEYIYIQKINDLEELKKSILQKAFAGELKTEINISKPIVDPIKVSNISPTDLQAGIIAIALKKHKEKRQEHTFHHVKAEKIIHLAEAFTHIDLERNPVKDAAGPNDFPHSKKVESRALKAGFFRVFKIDGLYHYQEGSQFQQLINKTEASLNDKLNTINRLIDLMIPMNSQQAEIFATVYAAWNNLLIDNVPISDEAIVTEARENWHPDKLKIEREKFFKAIKWMKKEQLIPSGTGKKVSLKKSLSVS